MRVAGLGFRAAATLADLREALALAEAAAGRAEALATAAGKADAPALLALAAERGVPVLAVTVEGVPTPSRSAASLAAHGTGSVAEAAALAACPGGVLHGPRLVAPSGRATCAIAAAPAAIAAPAAACAVVTPPGTCAVPSAACAAPPPACAVPAPPGAVPAPPAACAVAAPLAAPPATSPAPLHQSLP